MMRRTIALAAFALAAFFASGVASAGSVANEFQLATGYAAKEACSCVFVAQQSDAYCTNYGVSPTGVAVTLVIDHTASTVTASFSSTSRVATFTSGKGCVLAGL
jgi:hypothetical protein